MFTGKMPNALGVNFNGEGDNKLKPADKEKGLGHVLNAAGYDAAYGGKWRAHEAGMVDGNGFKTISGFGDMVLAENCIDYLKSRKDNPLPFFLVASFDNPHNICEWARNEPLPYGNITPVSLNETPELPVNFKISPTFLEALQIEQNIDLKVYPTQNYTDEDWRQYRYTYYRLVEKVDKEIGKILDAIDNLGLRDNTVIIFTSDHGDGNASHGWNQKTALFQESIKVPFIINYKGINTFEEKINNSLISSGLDLFPTICDFVKIDIPKELLGKSIKKIIEKENKPHNFVVVETKFEGKNAYGTMGRALVTNKYKYVLYNWGKTENSFLIQKPIRMKCII